MAGALGLLIGANCEVRLLLIQGLIPRHCSPTLHSHLGLEGYFATSVEPQALR